MDGEGVIQGIRQTLKKKMRWLNNKLNRVDEEGIMIF